MATDKLTPRLVCIVRNDEGGYSLMCSLDDANGVNRGNVQVRVRGGKVVHGLPIADPEKGVTVDEAGLGDTLKAIESLWERAQQDLDRLDADDKLQR